MKVLFVNRFYKPDESATSQILTDLATALARAGVEVHVVCSRQLYDRPRARLAPRALLDGVAVHRVWSTRFGRAGLPGRALDYLSFYVFTALTLLRWIEPGDVLVAKTDPPLMSLIAWPVARWRRAHLVNWLQDIFPEVATALGANPLPRPLDRLVCWLRDRSLRAAALNVVLGERMRQVVGARGVPEERVRIIENWAELQGPEPVGPLDTPLRAAWGLDGKFVVGYSGNLGRAHDYDTVLAAALRLRNEPDIVFLMIGGGAGMRALERRVRELALENFCFQPYQPRHSLAESLAVPDVHWVSLQPSLEGYIVPSKFYGILAVGRPIAFIGDPDGEIARQVSRADCGAAFAVDDADGLVARLLAWRARPEERERLGANARRAYLAQAGAARAVESWQKALTEVCRSDDAVARVPSNR